MRFIKCLFLLLLCFLVFSCVTENSVFTANAPNETQLYFLRPTQIKVKNQNLKVVGFDITLYVKDNELVGTPILNCTYYIPTQS